MQHSLRALSTIIMVAFSTEKINIALEGNLRFFQSCICTKFFCLSVWPVFLLCVVLEAIKFKWNSLPWIQICTSISVKWQDTFHLPGTELELISPISKPHLQLCQCSGLSLSCKSVGFSMFISSLFRQVSLCQVHSGLIINMTQQRVWFNFSIIKFKTRSRI